MTQDELIEQGVNRFRRPMWANPHDYARIDIIDGKRGPWMHLWARHTQEVCNFPTPQDVLNIEHDTTTDYEPYTGLLDPSDTKP